MKTSLSSSRALPLRAVLRFTQGLALMTRHGIPLTAAFDLLAAQPQAPQFQQMLRDIANELQEGLRLSAAFKARRNLFPGYFPELIFAAEESGSLDELLAQIQSQLERDIALRRELLSASLYPCLVCAISLIVGLFVLAFVVPAFRELFAEFDAQLPLVTRAAFALSDAALAAAIPASLTACAGLFAAQTPRGKAVLSRVLLRIPVYGRFLSRCSFASITGILATVLSSGLPLSRALVFASHASAIDSQRAELKRFSIEVFEGKSLSRLIRSSSVFPPELAGVVETGEISGALDEVLRSLSRAFQEEARECSVVLKASVEPLLVAILGVFVGGLMLAVYLPIFELGGAVR